MIKLTVAFCICVVVTALDATAHAGTRLELSAGFVSTNFSVTPAQNLDSKSGLTLNASLEVEWMGLFSFEPGIGYVPKGYSLGTFNEVAHTLDLPLLVKAKFPRVGPFTPFVNAGPELGYVVTTYYSTYLGGVSFKDFDLALQVGGGFELSAMPGVSMFLRGAYSLGLINVVDQSLNAGVSGKSRVVLLTVGLILPL